MEFNWEDVTEQGLLDSIKRPEDYQIGIENGYINTIKALKHLPAPITNPRDLKSLHQLLFKYLSPWAGEFHWKQHIIGGQPGSDPDMRERELGLLGEQMGELCKLETNDQNIVRIATFYHIRLVTCHVFPDGNGRLSRLLMNHYLQTRLAKQPDIPINKTSYLSSLKTSRESQNLAPLSNILSQSWLGNPEPAKTIHSPFRLTPFQVEPFKKSWLEESRKHPTKIIALEGTQRFTKDSSKDIIPNP